ncbi:hypothetical protein P7C73_g3621, partial [Tremellales sp. Uapishka_1]
MLAWICGLVSLAAVAAWQPDYILRVSEVTITNDCTPRPSVVINGTSPGPLLTFQEGQHIWVRVFNDLAELNTTVHWHGFSQFASPFSDGTPQAAAWPIPPGHFYDYEFQLEPGFIGTYWTRYHSHVQMQVLTAQGPIIVEAANKTAPVEYDEEIVMMMGDSYHASDEALIAGVLNTTLFGWIGEPQALLVNGHALAVCNQSALPTGLECTTSCGNNQQYIQPGKKYRVRVIGAGILSYFGMALEGHNMTLFEVDGTYINPMPIDQLEIGVGQRYSVLIETVADPPKTDYYWRIRTMWRPTRVEGAALWTYAASASTSPFVQNSISTAPTPVDLNTTVYLANETFGWVSDEIVQWNQTTYAPSTANVTRTVVSLPVIPARKSKLTEGQVLNGQQLVDQNGFRWSVDNHLYNEMTYPAVPYLLQFYNETEAKRKANYAYADRNGGYDNMTNTYPAKLGEILDIVIQNRAGPTSGMVESHPWHSHGAKYWDMGGGMGNFTYEALAKSTATPFLRDTSVAYSGPGASWDNQTIADDGPGGWRLFRIEITDPGAWLIHCHLTAHMIMGMQTLFMYAPEELPPIPSSLLAEYSTFSGGAYGDPTYDYVPKSYYEAMSRA